MLDHRIARPFAAAPLLGGLALGCATTAAAPADRGAGESHAGNPAAGSTGDAAELRDARLAWCNYLQAVFVRTQGNGAWSRFSECANASTTASARMMKETADCSLRELQQFEGAPLSDAYAKRASLCVASALHRGRVNEQELASFVGATCGRAAACGQIQRSAVGECVQSIEVRAGNDLEAVIGAINVAARGELRTCLEHSSCTEDERIKHCLVPILDRLLWLPT